MKRICVLLLLIVVMLTSCGKSSQENSEAIGGESFVAEDAAEWWGQVQQTSQSFSDNFVLQETILPDADAPLRKELKEGGRIWQTDLRMLDGVIYRIVSLVDSTNLVDKIYLQRLKPPYDQWVLDDITEPAEVLVEGDFQSWHPNQVIGEADGAVYCTVFPYSPQHVYLGRYDQDGLTVLQVLAAITDEVPLMNHAWGDKDGSLYFFSEFNSSVLMLSDNYETEKYVSMPESVQNIQGMLWNPQKKAAYCYGSLGGQPGIWAVEGEESLLEGFDGMETYDAFGYGGFRVAIGEEGIIYLVNTQEFWSYGGEQSAHFKFTDKDYVITEIYDMETGDDGSQLIYANVDGEDCLLRVQMTDQPQAVEKQEIVLALLMKDDDLQRAVTRFNRQSDQYRVTVNVIADDKVLGSGNYDPDEIRTNMQMTLSAGHGPDILDGSLIMDVNAFASSGILAGVDDILEDGEQYLPGALEGAMVGDKLYGIPYKAALDYAVYSQDFSDGRTSWTLPELMDAVRASDAKILHSGYDGLTIVRFYGLSDDGNTAFIDWEQGQSHLTEAPFLELLEFAKEYADNRENAAGNSQMLKSGEIVTIDRNSSNNLLVNMNYMKSCFEGKPAYLGYPRTDGNGIYLFTYYLYLNSSSPSAEGAKEFLRWLISEEAQTRYVFQASPRGVFDMSSVPDIPVNMGAIDDYFNACRNSVPDFWLTIEGINVEVKNLTDEDGENLRRMVSQAHSYNWRSYEVMGMVYEELSPYFAGDVSAEEAARKLNNRVQLYLDENK